MELNPYYISGLVSSALKSCPDDSSFFTLTQLLLSRQNFQDLHTLVSKYPTLIPSCIETLIGFIETCSSYDHSQIHQFFSYSLLSLINFNNFPIHKIASLQYCIWDTLIETNLKELQPISDLFLNFSINIQISLYTKSSLFILTIKKLSPRAFEIMARRGFFQLFDKNYNGLIHLIEVFPKNCGKIIKDLMTSCYPELYDDRMRSILLAVYMQDKFSDEQKLERVLGC